MDNYQPERWLELLRVFNDMNSNFDYLKNNTHHETNSRPGLYEVVILKQENDSKAFIEQLLRKFFKKSDEEIILTIKESESKDYISCGYFTREVAETKVIEIIELGKKMKVNVKSIMRARSINAV